MARSRADGRPGGRLSALHFFCKSAWRRGGAPRPGGREKLPLHHHAKTAYTQYGRACRCGLRVARSKNCSLKSAWCGENHATTHQAAFPLAHGGRFAHALPLFQERLAACLPVLAAFILSLSLSQSTLSGRSFISLRSASGTHRTLTTTPKWHRRNTAERALGQSVVQGRRTAHRRDVQCRAGGRGQSSPQDHRPQPVTSLVTACNRLSATLSPFLPFGRIEHSRTATLSARSPGGLTMRNKRLRRTDGKERSPPPSRTQPPTCITRTAFASPRKVR